MEPVRAYVALGSNLGEPRARLDAGLAALGQLPGVELLRCSSFHTTAAVGGPTGQPDYLNAVAELRTTLTPLALLDALQAIEAAEGRDRSQEVRFGPRTLDLDLLLYGDLCLDSDRLSLPHPRLEQRAFVLAPLAELDPDLVLLRSGLSVRERLAELQCPRAPIATLRSVREAREWCQRVRAEGRSLGFVPTMGALHEGHLSLVRRALRENDLVCISVFVNPLQFDEQGDLDNYPRDFEGDAALLEGVGASMVFTGTLAEFFEGELDESGGLPRTRLLDPGPCAEGLEGSFRRGHFPGVATIVGRLFDVVQPDRAYFGQKDYQQARVVSELAARRGAPEVVVCPTSREPSGLARSSRNTRLDARQRELATAISRALFRAAEAWQAGERRSSVLRGLLHEELDVPGLELEYAALRPLEGWSAEEPHGDLESAVALVAARVGPVRLIDNFVLSDPIPSRLVGVGD
jgi:pantoate--beta-alanine ligase